MKWAGHVACTGQMKNAYISEGDLITIVVCTIVN